MYKTSICTFANGNI